MTRRSTLAAALAFVTLAFAMTWPLGRHLTTALPGDLGDPAFNCWVLMWTGGQILRALSGHPGALADYWNGNIFYPAPLTIAYSEHLTPETLQALPFYGATGNIILGYNVVFLSTFALAGLGMFLLVREWTRQPLAAFLAGVAFAYAPYRLAQLPHLQVLSTQWMPFALYGLRRYFDTRRLRALAGGTAALVVQSLSCGYFMLFFTPFFAAYGLYELASRRLLRDRRLWLTLGAAGALAATTCLPFVVPYFEVRATAPVGVRTLEDVVSLSADTHAFATAPAVSRIWSSRLSAFSKPEGEGFPGLTILLFAAVGLVGSVRQRLVDVDWRRVPLEGRLLATLIACLLLGSSAMVVSLFAAGRMTIPFSAGNTVLRGSDGPLEAAAAALLALLVLSTLAPRRAPGATPSGAGFSALALLAAALLALGPRIEAAGHRLGVGPYSLLFDHVPGFDGLRVPARFLMIVALFMAALAGFGAAWLLRAARGPASRLARGVVVAGACAVLVESLMAPMPINQSVVGHGLRPVRALSLGRGRPPVYDVIRGLPGPVVLLELPIGDPSMDIPAVFYAGFHRRPLVNGYSGFWPPRYFRVADLLMRATADPPEATSLLEELHVTHVLVHEAAFVGDRGRALSGWLQDSGARIVYENDADTLFQVTSAGR